MVNIDIEQRGNSGIICESELHRLAQRAVVISDMPRVLFAVSRAVKADDDASIRGRRSPADLDDPLGRGALALAAALVGEQVFEVADHSSSPYTIRDT